jgi:Protein of unknown function (DUF2470)
MMTAPSDGEKTIPLEVSQRICDHMNADHAVSVHAMAKRVVELPKEKGWKISNAQLKLVTMNGAELRVTFCRGDACQQQTVTYPFVPPLTEPTQIRSRMIAIHHRVCTPFSFYNHALFPSVVVFFAVTAWHALWPGQRTTDPFLGKCLHDCFYLMLYGHLGLAIFGTYMSLSVLKLTRIGACLWFVAIFLSGYLGLRELQDLVDVQDKSEIAKKEKSS